VARVTVQLPTLLRRFAVDAGDTGSEGSIAIEADSLAGALQKLVAAHPSLGVHLFDESGQLREHVLCFHNRTNTRWMDSLNVALADDDTITILQAVSGG